MNSNLALQIEMRDTDEVEESGLDFHCKPELLDRYLPWSGYVKDKCK